MSSAKTIADILAFAELIDVKSFIGNPFTSQPMYIAACAFLAEVAAHASQPPSRGASPSAQSSIKTLNLQKVEEPKLSLKPEQHLTAKHTLLATAANQNYQRCYKALKALERYWAGTRYILTALDQKSKGIMDPLLFTSDDIDSEMPSTELNFTTPGWRRSTSQSASMGTSSFSGPLSRLRGMADLPKESNWSSNIDLSQGTNKSDSNPYFAKFHFALSYAFAVPFFDFSLLILILQLLAGLSVAPPTPLLRTSVSYTRQPPAKSLAHCRLRRQVAPNTVWLARPCP